MTPSHWMRAGLCAPFLILPAGALAQDDARDVLRFATSFEILNLDPIQEGYWMQEFGVGELLMQFRADGQFHPWLLESIESRDELSWVMQVRRGVTFQNGKPMSGAAVLAAIEHQMANSSGARGSFPDDARFTLTGEYEITFTTSEPFPALPGLLAQETVFVIYDAETVEAAGADVASLAGQGIYTGPYEIAAHDGQRLTLERYEDYWQGEPAMAGVTVDYMSDTNARLLAVQNGEVDIALFMPIAVKGVVEQTPGLHFNYDTPSSNSYSTFLNLEAEPFEDARVRLAFSKALDYAEIADEVFQGVFEPANSFYGPVFPWADANVATDVAEAERLLDEAGWIMGADGMRYRDGEPLELEIVYNPGVTDLIALGTALQAQLSEIGMGVNITQVPDTYAAYETLDWDAGIHNQGTGGNGIPETFLRRYLASDGDRNYGGYANAEIDALAEELGRTVDPARRDAILARVQEIVIDEDPYALILVFSRLAVVTNDAYAHYQPGFNFFNLDWQTQPKEDAS